MNTNQENIQKGDTVICAIRNEHDVVKCFTVGTCIFSGPYFVTVEVECRDAITGRIVSRSDSDNRKPYKLRYTFDSLDLCAGAIKKGIQIDDELVVPVSGFNPMQLNNRLKNTVIRTGDIHGACLNYSSLMNRGGL